MFYIETTAAAVIYKTKPNSIVQAIKRGSDRYFHLYVDGAGHGGKKLLIGVSEQQLGEAMIDGRVETEIEVYDEAGLPTQFKPPNTVILDTKNEKTAPDMQEFLNASEAQQKKTIQKLEVLDLFERESARKTVARFIDELPEEYSGLKVSETKLFRWRKARKEVDDNGTSPLVALLDKRGARKGKTQLTQEMQDMAARLLCRRDNPLRVTAIHRNMKQRFGDAMPSYDVLNNFLTGWKAKNRMVFEMAQDADKFKNENMAAFGSLSEQAKYPNHYWELDSTPADVITSDGKRWAVLCAIDVFSRRAVFLMDERSSSYSIARLLRKAILTMGIPEHVVIDNGKDYRSNHFQSICYNLSIKQVTVPPFSGDMKPHVERIFRTLSTQLFEEMPGYIGHSVAERQRIQSRRGFEHKIRSQQRWQEEAARESRKVFVDGFKIRESNVGAEVRMNIEPEKLEAWIDKWTVMYENTVHRRIRMTPFERWQSDTQPVKSISDPRMLDLLLGESFVRKVGKDGIRLDGAQYLHVELANYIGDQVRLMCPDNRGYVHVYTMGFEPICIAEDPEYLGESRAKYAEGKKISKRIMRQINALLQEWEAFSAENDPGIRDRIEAVAEEVGGTVAPAKSAVTPATETIRNVLEASKTFAEQDRAAVDASNVVNMEGEKLLPSGRPAFASFFDRMLWDINNDRVDEGTMKIANKYPDLWELAQKEAERQKIG